VSFDNPRLKRQVRGKIRAKLSAKAEKDPSSIFAQLKALPNDTYFTRKFIRDHVVREEPSGERAVQIATARNLPVSTLLFLPGGEYQALADDIREGNRKWVRKPPGGGDYFFTAKEYTLITVTAVGALYVPGEPLVSRIQFGVEETDETVSLNGGSPSVYAINHFHESYAVGNKEGVDEDDEDTDTDEDTDSEDEASADYESSSDEDSYASDEESHWQ
jgi:hypothetical protein